MIGKEYTDFGSWTCSVKIRTYYRWTIFVQTLKAEKHPSLPYPQISKLVSIHLEFDSFVQSRVRHQKKNASKIRWIFQGSYGVDVTSDFLKLDQLSQFFPWNWLQKLQIPSSTPFRKDSLTRYPMACHCNQLIFLLFRSHIASVSEATDL